jgi:hypothetical protein
MNGPINGPDLTNPTSLLPFVRTSPFLPLSYLLFRNYDVIARKTILFFRRHDVRVVLTLQGGYTPEENLLLVPTSVVQ